MSRAALLSAWAWVVGLVSFAFFVGLFCGVAMAAEPLKGERVRVHMCRDDKGRAVYQEKSCYPELPAGEPSLWGAYGNTVVMPKETGAGLEAGKPCATCLRGGVK